MKRLIASTAVALMIASPAFADDMSKRYVSEMSQTQILGSDLIGARLYAAENDFADDYEMQAGDQNEWDDVGEINDVVLTRDGEVEAVIAGIGGFIGIGEKDVAVRMNELKFVSDGENATDYFIVFTSNKVELESAPAWKSANRWMAEAEIKAANDVRRTEAEMNAARTERLGRIAGYEREGYRMVKATEMKADDLIGATVYGLDDENVGEVSDIVLGSEGNAKQIVLDIGGFLGMGEHSVAVGIDELKILQQENDPDDLRVHIDASEESLEALP